MSVVKPELLEYYANHVQAEQGQKCTPDNFILQSVQGVTRAHSLLPKKAEEEYGSAQPPLFQVIPVV